MAVWKTKAFKDSLEWVACCVEMFEVSQLPPYEVHIDLVKAVYTLTEGNGRYNVLLFAFEREHSQHSQQQNVIMFPRATKMLPLETSQMHIGNLAFCCWKCKFSNLNNVKSVVVNRAANSRQFCTRANL